MKRNQLSALDFFTRLLILSTAVVGALLFFSSSAFASNACVALLHNKPAVELKVDSLFEDLSSSKDPRFKRALPQLLLMAGQSRDAISNSAGIRKRGEIIFARPLVDGYSVEFEYKADRRSSEQFRLRSAKLVMPNGTSTKLADELTNETGTELLITNLPMKLGPEASSKLFGKPFNLEMPLKITEDLLREYTTWSNRFEFLDAQSIRKAGERGSLLPLYLKYQWNSHVDLFFRRSQIYYVRAIIVGTAFAAATVLMDTPMASFAKVLNYFSPTPVVQTVRSEDAKHAELQKIIAKPTQVFVSTTSHYDLVSRYSAIENSTADGKVSIIGALEGSTSKEHFTAVTFKNSEKIILTRFSTTGEVRGVVLSADQNPTEYQALLKIVEHGTN